MEISWLNHACFQLRGKNALLLTDPFSPQSGEPLRLSKISPTIVTLSHIPAHNTEPLQVGSTPYIVRGPGEYEISDVLITGIASYQDEKKGKEYGRNTIYVIHIDDLVVCHLGALGHVLQEEDLEEIADADVLFIPVSGNRTINATQAAEVISQIEPRIVIPIYSATSESAGRENPVLDKFCREMGIQTLIAQPKINVTRASLPAEMQVVLLAPR